MFKKLSLLPSQLWLGIFSKAAGSDESVAEGTDLRRRMLLGGGLAALGVTAAGLGLTVGSDEAEAGHGRRRSRRWGHHGRYGRRRRRRRRRHRRWRSNRYGYGGYGAYAPRPYYGGGYGGPAIILDF